MSLVTLLNLAASFKSLPLQASPNAQILFSSHTVTRGASWLTPTAPSEEGPAPTYGAHSFYRWVFFGQGHRRCRLEPTCSAFALQAIQTHGLWKGFLWSLARAQMEHSHQGEFLKRRIANDGHFIYHDPLHFWK
jgi:hypothetical protein